MINLKKGIFSLLAIQLVISSVALSDSPDSSITDNAEMIYPQCLARPELYDPEIMARTMANPKEFMAFMTEVSQPGSMQIMMSCASNPEQWTAWMSKVSDPVKMMNTMQVFMQPQTYMNWMNAFARPQSR